MIFSILVAFIGVLAGAVAAVAGFGIGSLLTPLLSIKGGLKLAVAAVSLPHMLGTALRLWLLRKRIDRRILLNFGVLSAAGGLAGALLHSHADNPTLEIVFAALLIAAGVTGTTGLSERIRFRGVSSWIAGALSGLLGGLVGNQGGIRSAAMLGIDVPKTSFVATATAIALIVDISRVPVYLFTSSYDLWKIRYLIFLSGAGVIVGTVAGGKLLKKIPEKIFRRIVGTIILVIGLWMLIRSVVR